MPLIAPFEDGKFVTNNASTNSMNNAKESGKNDMDSNAFLTLLVAEMQNQDPLEPTSNTEWVSQYATFTQVSEIQAIGSSMQAMKAQDLVGEYVIMKVTDSQNGESDYVSGQVDYVEYEEGKAYLSIDGKRYSIDDLDTVASKDYMDAYNLAGQILKDIKELPNIDALTTSHKDLVYGISNKLNDMGSYSEKFIEKDAIDIINTFKNRMDLLVAAEKALKEANDEKAKEDKNSEGQTTVVNNTTNVTNVYNSESTNAEDKDNDEESEEAEANVTDNMSDEEIADALTKDISDDELSENAADNGAKEE